MLSGGDHTQGYEIDYNDDLRMVSMRCWGMWTMLSAEQYARDLHLTFASFDKGRPWYVVSDLREYPPQRPEVVCVHRKLIQQAMRQGLRRAASVVSSAMTNLQAKRVASESGMLDHDCHQTMSSALDWLLSDAHLAAPLQSVSTAGRAPRALASAQQ